MITEDIEQGSSLKDPRKPRGSQAILDALAYAEKSFRQYNDEANRIDQIYSAKMALDGILGELTLTDQSYDTFWASMEVLKPAIYAKPPRVIAKPRYSDASPADKVVAELIERVVNSEFERSNIDLHLREVRDDLALLNRGVLRVTYESKDGEKRVCIDHVDRLDYRHEPVRYWHELGWEAFGAWMTQPEMRERFEEHSGDEYKKATYLSRHERDSDDEGNTDEVMKALVWEVWSKTDNKVYWVTEGVDVVLDESDPYLNIRDFFPGPRPAYGTLKRRTLIPVPDFRRYAPLLDQINLATSKIYTLLQQVRLVGLLPTGGDVGDAIETAISENTAAMFIPVPSAALQAKGGEFVQFLPLEQVASAITGLIEARNQLFSDFDRLSGISDIMRGETEANETYGAQRLKSQYGSVRVRDKTDEIVRMCRDTARIAVEIICDNFDKKTLLEIAQMEIPTRSQVDKDIASIKEAAKGELEALAEKAREAAEQAQESGQEVDPAQAEQAFQQASQQITQKYAQQLAQLQNTVVIEDVMEVLKSRRDRALIIDIETDSTVLVDEIAEKQSRSELLTAFSGAMNQLQPLFALGDVGVKLAAGMLEFTLQPYVQGNRQIQQLLDELVEQAPQIAARMAAAQGGGENEALAEANNKLAEAEMKKADAALAGVQAKAQLDQAEMQRRFAELQQRSQNEAAKWQHENQKLQLQVADATTKATQAEAKVAAEIDKLRAETFALLVKAGVAQDQQALNEFKTVADVEARSTDQALAVEGQQVEREFRERGEQRADRQQQFTETQAVNEGGE